MRLLTGLTIGAWTTVGNAALTSNFPAGSTASGMSGDRLPNSTRVSGSLSLDQEFRVRSSLTGSVGSSVSYVGRRLGEFGSTGAPERQIYPAYTKVDLRTTLEYEAWRASFYINNVTDKRAAMAGGIGSFQNSQFFYIQPRTYGLSVSRAF